MLFIYSALPLKISSLFWENNNLRDNIYLCNTHLVWQGVLWSNFNLVVIYTKMSIPSMYKWWFFTTYVMSDYIRVLWQPVHQLFETLCALWLSFLSSSSLALSSSPAKDLLWGEKNEVKKFLSRKKENKGESFLWGKSPEEKTPSLSPQLYFLSRDLQTSPWEFKHWAK